jgi:hypothetical protein
MGVQNELQAPTVAGLSRSGPKRLLKLEDTLQIMTVEGHSSFRIDHLVHSSCVELIYDGSKEALDAIYSLS